MTASVIICSLVQASAVIFPPLADVFGVTSLSAVQWLIVICLSVIPLVIGEAGKILFTRKA